MKASVIIITKDQKDFLQKSLPVLLNQDLDSDYETIVVDSGSTDGAREYVASLPVKLIKIQPETFNFAKAFNLGAKKAKGKYLVRLSGDVVPIGESWLREMIKPFEDSSVGGTYGIYTITGREGYGYPDYWPAERFPKELTKYSIEPTPLMGIRLFGIEFGGDKAREKMTNFAGGCCAIRRDLWQKRPFNENLLAGEDAEYAWFLHLIGYDIVCNPGAKTIHEHELVRSKDKSFLSKPVFTKWMWVSVWQIAKYWLQRLILRRDPYENLRIGSMLNQLSQNQQSNNSGCDQNSVAEGGAEERAEIIFNHHRTKGGEGFGFEEKFFVDEEEN